MTRLTGLIVLVCGAAAWGAERPNIIFIMADDLGYADVGCFGQKLIKTPNIDRIAAEGVKFTQFYSGCTVCAPARSCLMTGQHTGHTWIRGNFGKKPEGRIPLRDEDVTVAEVLKKAGYATGIVGKWGLGEPETAGIPNKQGFDFWFGYLNQRHAHSYYPDYLWKNEEQYPLPDNRDGRGLQYSHDLMTREALAFIERSKDKPFYLYVAYTIPHAKLEVPSDQPYSNESWTQEQKNYAAMITRMDTDIGKLMKLLRTEGLDEETLVFFTSDNGGTFQVGDKPGLFASNGPLRGKKTLLYEGGIRVPMAARWPGRIKPGTTSEQVWAMWDFLPTAAELAGARPPESIDGISMVNALLGQPQKSHEFLYWEFHEGKGLAQAVRMGDWKAVRPGGKPIELYDLGNDLGEQNNVATQHPEIVARIETYLKNARTESPHWPTP